MKTITAILCLGATLCAQAIDGDWRGELSLPGATMPLVLHINDHGCSMDSPNQNAYGLPMEIEFNSADSVAVKSSQLGASIRGRLNGERLEATFEQRGFKMPLVMTAEEPLTARRPQTPKPPFPYTTTDTTFRAADGAKLAGTVTMPCKPAPRMPIVVMVSGSGPQNRDEEVFEHRPFAVIADYLARHGIASLRYDDRGTALSEGNFATATIDTLTNDAEAALTFARSLPGVERAGILGHSEGGTIALLLAAQRKPDFVVSLAGMVISGKKTLLAQNRHALEKMGLNNETVNNSMWLIEQAFDRLENENTVDIDALVSQAPGPIPPQILASIRQNVGAATPSFSRMLATNASKGLSKVKCPVLAINGDRDTQVAADSNLEAVRQGIKGAKIHKMAGLNHLLQHAETGEVSEYADIRETISEEVLALIAAFLLQ